jgi:histidinol-phosphatase (PHP family)
MSGRLQTHVTPVTMTSAATRGANVPEDWRFSLHGGHASESSRHATSNIDALVAAAEAAGLVTFGLVAHQPRSDQRFTYEEERGLSLDDLAADYTRFLERSAAALEAYKGAVQLLRGVELENLPPLDETLDLEAAGFRWQEHGLDFVVGSAHWVRGMPIDVDRDQWDAAAEVCGGAEELVLRYYEELDPYLAMYRPDIAGHFDVIRLFAPELAVTETLRVREAVDAVLATVQRVDALVEVNPSKAVRGMIEEPYPAGWIVERARDLGCAFTFGDDSHAAEAVGAGIDLAREHLLRHGVRDVTRLDRHGDGIARVVVPLD